MAYPRTSSASRGYGARWRAYRLNYLRRHPLCIKCKAAGLTVPSTVVDHIKPHKGDEFLFWNFENHAALCGHCHSSDKQRAEKGARTFYSGASVDGSPLDPKHHWSTG